MTRMKRRLRSWPPNSACWAGYRTKCPSCPSTTSTVTGGTAKPWELWLTTVPPVRSVQSNCWFRIRAVAVDRLVVYIGFAWLLWRVGSDMCQSFLTETVSPSQENLSPLLIYKWRLCISQTGAHTSRFKWASVICLWRAGSVTGL